MNELDVWGLTCTFEHFFNEMTLELLAVLGCVFSIAGGFVSVKEFAVV